MCDTANARPGFSLSKIQYTVNIVVSNVHSVRELSESLDECRLHQLVVALLPSEPNVHPEYKDYQAEYHADGEQI